ncbi:predicted protein [Naegleria gruberi]|uniref:Predicted protein n=1 Tax=Naegleria gruberi TaxID=5762 RepID=D2V6G1_NAEGR|nr:uncharacterized protein NAEGRDRAFT_31461 [Naegleria gruberi]EFC47440.1 predicted protein [Naegleria gruberi]|eukprot:XP_002680184.1 predicted protein [Naegleria gruberi strain NEG-M]
MLENNNIWLIDGLVSEEECQEIITNECEKKEFESGTYNNAQDRSIRNNSRLIMDNQNYSNWLWTRVKDYIPKLASELSNKCVRRATTIGYELCELSDKIRFYRYYKGEFFAPHSDGGIVLESVETIDGEEYYVTKKSFLTLLLYLNEIPNGGGETEFLNKNTKQVEWSVEPKPGRILLFVHENYHQAKTVNQDGDVKFVMRTDVLYRHLTKK